MDTLDTLDTFLDSDQSWDEVQEASALSYQPPVDSGESDYDDIISEASELYGVDPDLIRSVIKAESNFRPDAVSGAGAEGLMQLMPGTSQEMGVKDITNPYENIMGGAKYLARQLKTSGGDIPLALAAYNAGPGNVKKYGGIPPFAETQGYIDKVSKHYEGYKKSSGKEERLEPDPFDTFLDSDIPWANVQKEASKSYGVTGTWREGAEPGLPVSDIEIKTTGKYDFFDKIREMTDEPSDVLDIIPFVSGAKEVSEIAMVAGSAYKIDQGTATQEDQDRLVEFLKEANKDTTFGYKVLDTVSKMPAFMGEFLLTSGIYSAGRKVGTKVATNAIKKYLGKQGEKLLKKKIGKIGVKIVGGVAGGTIQAPIMGLPRIISGTIERSMPKLKLSENERGELSAMIAGEGEDIMPAVLKSFGDQWAETISEHSGGLFAELGTMAKNVVIKSGLLSAFLKSNLAKTPGSVVKLFKKMGYHGVINEMAEERLGEVLRAATGVTEEYNLPTLEQLAIELVSFSVPGVVQAIGSHVIPDKEVAKDRPPVSEPPKEGVVIAPPIDKIRTKFESGEHTAEDLEAIKEIWSDDAELSSAIDDILKPKAEPTGAAYEAQKKRQDKLSKEFTQYEKEIAKAEGEKASQDRFDEIRLSSEQRQKLIEDEFKREIEAQKQTERVEDEIGRLEARKIERKEEVEKRKQQVPEVAKPEKPAVEDRRIREGGRIGTERRRQERRDVAARKLIDKLSPEEKEFAIPELRRMLETQKKAALRQERIADSDPLTGLENRRGLRKETAKREKEGKETVHTFIDLIGFKGLNDYISHEAGDATLKFIAKAMKSVGLENSTRWGGDELMFQAESLEAGDADAQKLHDYFEKNPLRLKDKEGKEYDLTVMFRHGTAKSVEEADEIAEAAKETEPPEWKRGEAHPGLKEVSAKPEKVVEAKKPPDTGESLAKEFGLRYMGEADGLEYYSMKHPEGETTIATKGVDRAQLLKKIEQTKKTFGEIEPAKPTPSKAIHDYSSTQVNLPEESAKPIKELGRKIPDKELYTEPDDDSYGREEAPHITVRYGLETSSPEDVAPAFEDIGPIKVKFGKVSIFESDDYDVVKVDVESPDLIEANKKVGETVKLPGETFKDYKPHATIAYVKKGEGKKYVGDKSLEGQEVIIDSIFLSAKDGKMHEIKLKPTPAPEKTEVALEGVGVEKAYRPGSLEDAIKIRKEHGSLDTYDLQSKKEWLGGKKPPDDGKLTIYRATPTGKTIEPGDYVTNDIEYAKQHIESNLGGKGKIARIEATLDDIYPADSPKEFWYAPKSIEPLYSAAKEVTPKTTADKVFEIVLPYLQGMTNFPTVRVVQSVESLPKKLKSKVTAFSKKANKQVEGFYDKEDGQVFLIADNLSEGRIEAVLRHEAEGHRGIRLLLGSDLDGFLDGVAKAKRKDLERQDPDLNFEDQAAVRVAADEWIARKIEAGNLRKSFWDDLVRVFRKWLRKIVPNLSLTDNEIRSVLVDTVKNVREGRIDRIRTPEGRLIFSSIADQWYSQMTRFMSDKLPGKSPPAQFKQTINAWAKKGLIKQEELDWSGLNEWLDGQEGKITKQQVLDFLAENNVRIEEVVKGSEFADSAELEEKVKEKFDEVFDWGEWLYESKRDAARDAWDYDSDHKIWKSLKASKEDYSDFESFWDDVYDLSKESIFTKNELEDILAEAMETSDALVDEISKEIKEDYEDETKFSQWVLPGGERYKELLLTLPVREYEISKKIERSVENNFKDIVRSMEKAGVLEEIC